jgi:nucleoside-diphosphate-sugar epimerase
MFDSVSNGMKSAEYREPRQGYVRDSRADISLAEQLLGYKPIIGFREGLAHTLQALQNATIAKS